jgi:hypothetical protein
MTSTIHSQTTAYSPKFTGAVLALITSKTWQDFLDLSMEEREVRLQIEKIDKQIAKIFSYLIIEKALYRSRENPNVFVVCVKNTELANLKRQRKKLHSSFKETKAKLDNLWKDMHFELIKTDPVQTPLFMRNDVNKYVQLLWQERSSSTQEAHTPKNESKETKSS